MIHNLTLNDLREQGLILFETLSGSHAYGTALPTSDRDIRGVFILPEERILGLGVMYREQVNDDKNDIVFYEIRRFLELLSTNNPTVLELLNAPPDCIISKHPLFDQILAQRDTFITKACRNSFAGYARQQIQKAKGLNKKMNWEKERTIRKGVLDFCYVTHGQGSILIKDWIAQKNSRWMNKIFSMNLKLERFGLARVTHMRDMYAVFYDPTGSKGYKGMVSNEETANEVSLSSIAYGDKPVCYMQFNKDAYSIHCELYRSYQTWLKNSNKQRYVDTAAHGQQIDGKNMMHCMRLVQMSEEIASGQGIIVRRPNAQELLDIRHGKVDLETLISRVEDKISNIDTLFEQSGLPDSCEPIVAHELLVKIRKEFYAKR